MSRLHLFLASIDQFLQSNPQDALLRLTVVSVEQHGFRYRFPGGENRALVAQTCRRMSPTESAIVQVLSDGAWHKGTQISIACGFAKSNAFSVILGNLVETGTIESGHFGYRLKHP